MYLFLLEHAEEWLNSNIRCIEIVMILKNVITVEKLNSNIRCIEILLRCRKKKCLSVE